MISFTRKYKQLNRNSKNYKSNLNNAINNGWKIEIESNYTRTLLSKIINK